jgi:glycosyltransferase involved in cell wall biosynthesis
MSESRPLNVLHVCDHLGWEGSRMHGVKRLFAWMLPRFDPALVKPALVSLRKKDLSEETLDALGVDITYLQRGKFDPATLTDLLKEIDRRQIDVLHLHGYGATTFGRLAAKMKRLPVVLHEHANLTSTPWFQQLADRVLAGSTDIAIAVSESTADFVRGARKVPPDRVKVVYLGAPLEEFSRTRTPEEVARTRQELGLSPDDFAVGTVTRLHDSKGNQFLVAAARDVLAARPQARFILVGEGPLREPLEAQAQALGLGDRFRFHGFHRDTAAVLSAFDLSVFPSLWEGTPLTAFEALAAGKPIVSTDADGLLDILEDGVTAWVVPCRDSAALARAIVYAIDHPAERTAKAEAARVAGRGYDIAAFVRKMERLYALLHETSRPTGRRVALEADLSFLDTRTAGASGGGAGRSRLVEVQTGVFEKFPARRVK